MLAFLAYRWKCVNWWRLIIIHISSSLLSTCSSSSFSVTSSCQHNMKGLAWLEINTEVRMQKVAGLPCAILIQTHVNKCARGSSI